MENLKTILTLVTRSMSAIFFEQFSLKSLRSTVSAEKAIRGCKMAIQ